MVYIKPYKGTNRTIEYSFWVVKFAALAAVFYRALCWFHGRPFQLGVQNLDAKISPDMW